MHMRSQDLYGRGFVPESRAKRELLAYHGITPRGIQTANKTPKERIEPRHPTSMITGPRESERGLKEVGGRKKDCESCAVQSSFKQAR